MEHGALVSYEHRQEEVEASNEKQGDLGREQSVVEEQAQGQTEEQQGQGHMEEQHQ